MTAEMKRIQKEIEAKHVRLDGKQLTQKQKEELVKKELEKFKKDEDDFDPR